MQKLLDATWEKVKHTKYLSLTKILARQIILQMVRQDAAVETQGETVVRDQIPDDVLPTARLFSTLEGTNLNDSHRINGHPFWAGLGHFDGRPSVFSVVSDWENHFVVTIDTAGSRETLELSEGLEGLDLNIITYANPNQLSSYGYHNNPYLSWRTQQTDEATPWRRLKDLDPELLKYDRFNDSNSLVDLAQSLINAAPLPELIG